MQLIVKPILEQLGLTENEIKVYEAMLKRKSAVASTLAREMGLDKSSTYRALESMAEQGLVIVERKKRGTTYQIGSLQILKDSLQKKMMSLKNTERGIDEVIESIKNQALIGERDTYIKVEKGIEAHMALMEKSLDCKEKIIREKFPLPGEYFSGPEYKKYIYDFVQRRVSHKIIARNLYSFAGKPYESTLMKTSKEMLKELRILPTELDNKSYFKVWDDYVEIITFDNEAGSYAVIIVHDLLVASLMKSLFDYIWARSPKYFGKQTLPTRMIGQSEVSVMGIGTWGVGGYMTKNEYNDDLSDIEQIRSSLGKGINYIDTSHAYGAGSSLPLVRQAISNFPRSSYFINSKIGYMVDQRSDVAKMCDNYLKELNLDYIDRLMIHAPRAINIPIEDVVEEIDKLIDAGKVRYLGVSNFNVDQLKLVQNVARHPLSGHEIHYNLMIRANEENRVVDYCENHNILMTIFQPIRRGFLVGLEDPILSKLADKYSKTQAQIMLNWLSSKKYMMFLIKATKGGHVNENAAALGWKMDKKDYELLDNWRMPGYVTPEYDKTGCAKDGIKIDKL